MFIARHQLFLTNAKRICKERKKVGRHITVVHKTSYRTYLTLLYLFLQLLYHVLCRNIVYKHIGIYAYKRDFLLAYAKMAETPLEHAESLEQLRALENGYRIKVIKTPYRFVGVDTTEDLEKVNAIYRQMQG